MSFDFGFDYDKLPLWVRTERSVWFYLLPGQRIRRKSNGKLYAFLSYSKRPGKVRYRPMRSDGRTPWQAGREDLLEKFEVAP